MSRIRQRNPKFIIKKEKLIKLEYLRKKYGYSQEDMAEILGIDRSTYSQKVNRRLPIVFEEMLIITMAINRKAEKSGDNILKLDDIFLN